MARVDDYHNAFRIAAAKLASKDPEKTGELGGADTFNNEDGSVGGYEFEFIGRKLRVSAPAVRVYYADSDDEVPITEQVLILHYLNMAKGVPLSGETITYREIPSGEFYYQAFMKRAEIPMLKVFGYKPDLLPKAAPLIGGRPVEDQGDAAASFPALPRVPITLVVWGGDDEFEPGGKILFDRSIQHYLSTEDVAWISGMVVYRLMKLASQVNGEKR